MAAAPVQKNWLGSLMKWWGGGGGGGTLRWISYPPKGENKYNYSLGGEGNWDEIRYLLNFTKKQKKEE